MTYSYPYDLAVHFEQTFGFDFDQFWDEENGFDLVLFTSEVVDPISDEDDAVAVICAEYGNEAMILINLIALDEMKQREKAEQSPG